MKGAGLRDRQNLSACGAAAPDSVARRRAVRNERREMSGE